MEAVIFIGLPASGKTTFYQERFFRTHVRIGLDLLKTRDRCEQLLHACLQSGQRLVVDGRNIAAAERQPWIEQARASRFQVTGYYFRACLADCLQRNGSRSQGERVSYACLLAQAGQLEPPQWTEGFDRLHDVSLAGNRPASQRFFVERLYRDPSAESRDELSSAELATSVP